MPSKALIHGIGTVNTSYQLTEQERATLRKKHANSCFEYQGKLYLPSGGITAAGTTPTATMAADRVLHALKWFEKEYFCNPNRLREACLAQGVTLPAEPEFVFDIR